MTILPNQPSPVFLTVILVGIAAIGMSFPAAQPYVMGLVIIILLGMLLIGYGQIHATFSTLLTGSPT